MGIDDEGKGQRAFELQYGPSYAPAVVPPPGTPNLPNANEDLGDGSDIADPEVLGVDWDVTNDDGDDKEGKLLKSRFSIRLVCYREYSFPVSRTARR